MKSIIGECIDYPWLSEMTPVSCLSRILPRIWTSGGTLVANVPYRETLK